MYKPSPTPPRSPVSSTWRNGSKINDTASGGMPIPSRSRLPLPQLDAHALSAGVAHDVRHRFLHNAEERGLQIGLEALRERIGHELDRDPRALCLPIQVPPQRGNQPEVVE